MENHLTKEEILALFLDSAEMGSGPDNKGWTTGFWNASRVHFGKEPRDLTRDEAVLLVAGGIAPARFIPSRPSPALRARATRIHRMLDGKCTPLNNRDVWLKGCNG